MEVVFGSFGADNDAEELGGLELSTQQGIVSKLAGLLIEIKIHSPRKVVGVHLFQRDLFW